MRNSGSSKRQKTSGMQMDFLIKYKADETIER